MAISKDKNRSLRSLRLERLEDRQLMAVTPASGWLDPATGKLSIEAKNNLANTVIFREQRGMVTASITAEGMDPRVFSFSRLQVKSISFEGSVQADIVRNLTAVPSTLKGGRGDDFLWGGSGRDHLYGEGDNDHLYGGGGRDFLSGGAGNNWCYGEGEKDAFDPRGEIGFTNTFLGGPGDDEYSTVSGTGTHVIQDSEGLNSISLVAADHGIVLDLNHPGTLKINRSLTIDLSAALIADVNGSDYDDVITGNSLDNRIEGGAGRDAIHGGEGNDTLNGDYFSGWGPGQPVLRTYDDTLIGGPGNDTLDGGYFGKDLLEGGGDNDTLIACGDDVDQFVFRGRALGEDTIKAGRITSEQEHILNFRELGAPVSIDLAENGFDAVRSAAVRINLPLRLVSTVWGTAYSDTFRGDGRYNYFQGGPGNDVFFGGAGGDTLRGETGDDTYIFTDSRHIGQCSINDYQEARPTTNTLDLRACRTRAVVELAAGAINRVYGTPLSDTITGNDLDNIIYGLGGHDTIKGGHGMDVLYGGDGNDVLHGGYGDDILYGEGDNDSLYGDGNKDHLYGGDGNDGLFGGFENDKLCGGHGKDRFLTKPGVTPSDLNAGDARILIVNGNRSWTHEEVAQIDAGLRAVHERLGNTELFSNSHGRPLKFYRDSVAPPRSDGLIPAAENFDGLEAGKIVFYNGTFGTREWAAITAVHELAHNWDNRDTVGDLYKAFVSISRWQQTSQNRWLKGLDKNANWYYHGVTLFARDYGKTNPYEDIATTWETYFFGTDAEKARIGAKIQAVDSFMTLLGCL